MVRVVTGVLLLAVLWAVVFPAPYVVFVLVIALAIAIACWECYGMLATVGEEPFRFLGLAMAWGLVWAFSGYATQVEALVPIVLGGGLAFSAAMVLRDGPAKIVQTARGTLFPVILVALPLCYLLRIRTASVDGKALLTLLFVVVIVSDSMAFYVGSSIGRRRMAPTISPKKSWEGAIAGLVFGAIGAVGIVLFVKLAIPLFLAAFLGFLLAATGILGDLAISALKRSAGVKDTSALLPGHGGLLDRVDSLLFAAPTLYYYYQFVLQGGG